MGMQPEDVERDKVANDQQRPIDPLRRVWEPREWRNLEGAWTFKTTDGERYCRDEGGSIRRVGQKFNGKEVRKQRARARIESARIASVKARS